MAVYCRKLPLKNITTDTDIIDRINSLVFTTNKIITQTYQFTRLYFLYLLENNLDLPIIDREFNRLVFSRVSTRRNFDPRNDRGIELKKQMVEFYNTNYTTLQLEKIKTVDYNILDYESMSIITNIENHIKSSFFTYINRLVFSLSISIEDKIKQKHQRKKLREDMFNNTKKSEKEFHSYIDTFYPLITEAKTHLNKNPQFCIPLLYKISLIIEEKGCKQLAILPLRRSFIPSHITIDKTAFSQSFKDINEAAGIDLWNTITLKVNKLFKQKRGVSFKTMKTDGISCSIIFSSSNRYAKKTNLEKEENTNIKKQLKINKDNIYLEDLESTDELKDIPLVGIDPNKGNLVYCKGNNNEVLRYTQNSRRAVSRKSKYNKIRRSIEDDVIIKSPLDTDFHTIKDDFKDMMKLNSRSCSTVEFKKYILEKNKMYLRYSQLYQEPIFRKLKLNTFINMKSSEDKFINKFKNTYTDKAAIIFGDWEERPGFLRGKEPSKGASIRNMFKKAGFKVYLLDEFRTSKLCYKCHSENEGEFITRKHWKTDKTQKVWGLLRCKNGNCRCVHNRDFNSASNILNIGKSIINTGRKPNPFCRTIQTHANE